MPKRLFSVAQEHYFIVPRIKYGSKNRSNFARDINPTYQKLLYLIILNFFVLYNTAFIEKRLKVLS